MRFDCKSEQIFHSLPSAPPPFPAAPPASKGGRLSAPIPAKANAKLISRISCNYGGNWSSLTRFTLGKHTLAYPPSLLLPLKLSVVVFLVCLARFWLLFIAFFLDCGPNPWKIGSATRRGELYRLWIVSMYLYLAICISTVAVSSYVSVSVLLVFRNVLMPQLFSVCDFCVNASSSSLVKPIEIDVLPKSYMCV